MADDGEVGPDGPEQAPTADELAKALAAALAPMLAEAVSSALAKLTAAPPEEKAGLLLNPPEHSMPTGLVGWLLTNWSYAKFVFFVWGSLVLATGMVVALAVAGTKLDDDSWKAVAAVLGVPAAITARSALPKRGSGRRTPKRQAS